MRFVATTSPDVRPVITKENRMKQAKLSSSSRLSLFLIGQNSRGNRVVQDQRGLRGGLFVERAEALRFAMLENGNRPQAVIMVPGILELDMGRKPDAARLLPRDINAPHKRAA
jgi:hypothetical protein